MLLLSLAQSHDDASCRTAIAAATDVRPSNGRCFIVDESGEIIDVCNTDPALGSHPRGKLVANESAVPGDRHIDGVFWRRNAVASTSITAVASTARLAIADPTI